MGVDIRGRVQNLRSDEIALQPGAHRFANVLLASTADASLERYRDVVLYLPLIVQAQRIGLLILDNLTSQQPIIREDAALLKSFAGQIALAVDNARLFDEVQELSLYDSLTQLPLRRYFNQRVQEEMYRAERFGQPLSLVLIDIDFFKDINDRYGHQIGDQTLVEVSRVILNQLRKIDFPCRFGGDEILILLPQAKEDEAKMITSRLLQAIQKVRVPVPFAKAGEVGVTVSMGVATYPADSKTIEGLIEKADEALYWVKSHGRNGVAPYQGLTERSAQPGLFEPPSEEKTDGNAEG
jgi:diguanylate cyclase (GGDEF)-like protein